VCVPGGTLIADRATRGFANASSRRTLLGAISSPSGKPPEQALVPGTFHRLYQQARDIVVAAAVFCGLD